MNTVIVNKIKDTYYQLDVKIKDSNSASIVSKNRFPVSEIARLMDYYFINDLTDYQIDIREIELTEKEYENLNNLNLPVYILGQSKV